MSRKPYKSVAPEDRRSEFIRIRTTASEKLEIQEQALIRNLDVSKFLIRSALHRRADIKVETEMILAIREAVAAIKGLHVAYLDLGVTPPETVLAPVIDEAVEAILSLARY